MKTLIGFLLVFIMNTFSTNGFSQTYLTNGQVYDFNVGDIIQAKGGAGLYGATSNPGYETKTFLSKEFSKNNDSIIYKIRRDNYSIHCFNCTVGYYTDTINFIVTNLSSAVSIYNESSCGYSDTLYQDYGGLLVWESLPKSDTSCHVFEGKSQTTKYIQGLGGPYYTIFDASGPDYMEYILTYFKKSSVSWGILYTSTNDISTKPEVNLFPNPSSNKLYIGSTEEYVRFTITDLTSVVLKADKIYENSIDVSDLKSGLYFISLFTKDSKKVTQKILKK